MRKPRNKPEQEQPKKEEVSRYVNEPPKWDDAHLKTFKDQACEVLDYLDSIGEGIYDEGRYGGMYLHQPGTEGIMPTRLKKEFRQKSKQESKEENSESSEDIDTLKKLFAKK